jgi:acetyltransferase-like isoleucine patch superfamily enzyme
MVGASMDSERKINAPAVPGLAARIRRSWDRDSHLSFSRRVRKGVKFITQLIRARNELKECNRVGASPRVAGRLRVENRGSIEIGDHLNINSSWVPIEFVTGPAGRIQIGDDVLINFGTVIAASSRVTIGSGTMIGPHCIISDVDIPEAVAAGDSAGALPIEIGRDAWLAGRVTVRPGVKIGDGAVVVAGSIVESDVPANFMASGIPARLLPRLSVAPRPLNSARGAPARSRAAGTGRPGLRGGLISNFRLDDLIYELGAADGNPAVDSVLISGEPLPQLLAAAPPTDAGDFALVWTTPDAAVPAFSRLLEGESVEDRDLMAEVDAFCGLVRQSTAHYRCVLVPTWTQPAFVRGRGLLDGRSGGVSSTLSAMNLRLMKTLAECANVYVLDAARWQAAVGPAAFNPRAWYLGQIAMARPLLIEAARDIRAALATLCGRQRTLLVLRADDLSWAEARTPAAESAPFVQAHLALVQALRTLRRRGVRLALLGTLGATADGALQPEDFSDFAAGDGDEAALLGALAVRLGINLDAVVYVDSRDAGRTRLRAALPEVHVPDWPTDKLMFASAILDLRCFDAMGEPATVPHPSNE